MRYFLAIEPDSRCKLAIETWRDKSLPAFNSPVPVCNFHITLAFYGRITEAQLEQICQFMDQQTEVKTFDLRLDMQGYWSKPKAFWIGCKTVPDELLSLAKIGRKAARVANIPLQNQTYIPHLTLARKCAVEPPCALIEPDFEVKIKEFSLYESVSTESGVRYFKRFSWPLGRVNLCIIFEQ
ncbi:RNA 2',3'-cyclic phosphodiesterase [Catenovulum sediminis]|uniref:RNA 2',3'-cyclic phosphodiesterase n=1 Tax=Catenovulum sediminis TaxID=1740262 RepID=A0ABV1RFP5_9ALTE|nr:RNA 2',3'-cyclic phosphodiesterase [Catenovulum sediminis]